MKSPFRFSMLLASAMVAGAFALSTSSGGAETLYSMKVGDPASEKASKIGLVQFGKPETLGRLTCRNADESGLGDGKMGWGVITFPTHPVLTSGKDAKVILKVWGKSTVAPALTIQDKRKKKKSGQAGWTGLKCDVKDLSGQEKWETLTYELRSRDVNPGVEKLQIGLGGGDKQAWIAEIRVEVDGPIPEAPKDLQFRLK